MTTNEKRAAIARVYSSESWRDKVAKMSEAQVIAIYQKFLADGKFDREPIPRELFKPNYLGKFVFKDKKEESVRPKEDFDQLAMDGFSFPKNKK